VNDLNNQTRYWDDVAWEKTFSLPLDLEWFRSVVSPDQRILDYGCGYGRLCQELWRNGFQNLVGLDSSGEMIKRGRKAYPHLDLRTWSGPGLAPADGRFDAVLLVAVLTCLPTDEGQRELLGELFRALRPGGILYLTDFCVQDDERNRRRYDESFSKYGTYGVFELPEGAVFRHQNPDWIADLTADYQKVGLYETEAFTMNGHRAKTFHFMGRRT
jgi:SAM-dependent methyltransferase